MIGIGLNIGNRVMGGGGFDVDAQAFFDRVTTAGGTLTTTEQNATNQLVLDMKSAGIWSSMKAIYPMVGASAAACAQNLKSSSFTGTFTSGWTFASTGVTPNGTSAYFDTAMNPSTNLTKTSHHISFYSRTQNTSGNAWNIALGTSPDESNLSVYFAAVAQKGFLSGTYPASWTFSAVTNTLGLHIGSETSSTSSKLYQNSSLLTTNTNSNTTAFANYNYYIGAANKGTNADNFSLHQCAFASIGDGLTDTQASDFYTAVQAFQTTLSRQV
jgi:hypothetical protein